MTPVREGTVLPEVFVHQDSSAGKAWDISIKLFRAVRDGWRFGSTSSNLRSRCFLLSSALSIVQLSDDFGVLIAQSLSSPLCALKEVVVAENFFSDGCVEALSKGMRELAEVHGSSPLKNLDISNNKISSR